MRNRDAPASEIPVKFSSPNSAVSEKGACQVRMLVLMEKRIS